MKLTVQSDNIKELSKLLNEEFTYNLHLSFGKMYRSGYVPYFSEWDYYCIKNSLVKDYLPTIFNLGQRVQSQLCNISYVNQYNIIVCKVEEQVGTHIEKTIFHIDNKYDIILIKSNKKYEVEVEYLVKPSSTTDIFIPVKFLYSLLISRASTVENTTSIIRNYNLTFNKVQDTPWIVPQGLKFIDEQDFQDIENGYCVMPMINGNKTTLYLCGNGVFLFCSSNVLSILNQEVPISLYGTVITGTWHENNFTGYDIVRFGDVDVRKKSLVKRMKCLESVSNQFSFCKVVEYFVDNIYYNTHQLLSIYSGVIFAPISANYMNNRTFLYQDVDTVGINFKMSKYSKCGFNIVILKTDNDDTFSGTEDYPYESCIPISRDDCTFIGNLTNVVYEFRWDGNGFMPYQRIFDNSASTNEYAMSCWRYINKPVSKDTLLLYLKTHFT